MTLEPLLYLECDRQYWDVCTVHYAMIGGREDEAKGGVDSDFNEEV
jgi:hypothetical protein